MKILRPFFMGLRSFFDLAILSIFIKIFEFFKANKLYFFFVIKYQVIYHLIYNQMLFQKKYLSPTLSPWVGLESRSKADFEKKICEIFVVYQLLVTENKTNKNSERVNINLEYIRSYFFIFMRPQTFELFKKYVFSQYK